MALFSSTQPSLRARVIPRFPASVVAGAGMSIVKSGITYTFSAVFDDIPLSGLVDISTDRLLGRDTAGTGSPEQISVTDGIIFNGSGAIGLSLANRTRVLHINAFAPGSALSANQKADLFVPFACTITRWTLLADQSGSIVIDIWKAPYGSYPPTVANTITAADKPTISAAEKGQGSSLTGWTTGISALDTLRFNIDSIATITRISVNLEVVVI